jgi:hypothetical protein
MKRYCSKLILDLGLGLAIVVLFKPCTAYSADRREF